MAMSDHVHDIDIITYSNDTLFRTLISRSLESAPVKSSVTQVCDWAELLTVLTGRNPQELSGRPGMLIFNMDNCTSSNLKSSVEYIKRLFADHLYLIGLTSKDNPFLAESAIDYGVDRVVNFVGPIDAPRKLLQSIMNLWFDYSQRFYLD